MHARRAVAALLLAVCPLLFASTPEQWRQDLAYFARELPKRHANAFHAVSRETFDAAVKELEARAGTASDEEMVVGFMRLTGLVGDGHTNVHIPKECHRIAIQIQPFGDEWRVTRATAATKSILGAKVTAIGGVAMAGVMQRLAPLSPQDELLQLQRATAIGNMHIAEVLRGVGINPAEITAVADDGTASTVPITTFPLATQMQQAWVPLSPEAPPLSRRDPQSAFVIQNVPERKAVYVNWRRYENLSDNSAKLWQLVDSVGATTVVIDLRLNGGGDFKVGRRYMVSEAKKRAGKVKTIVLISARTFSAAMVNAIDFRNDAHAILAGEAIGEKPNSYSENDELTLPASRLVLSYSTRYYKFVPDDAPNVVEPDQRVEQTWADAKAGRDAALDWALSRK